VSDAVALKSDDEVNNIDMYRRKIIALVATTGLGGATGCLTLRDALRNCPDTPIPNSNIPPERRSIQFLSEENRTVEASDPPLVVFEPANSRIVIKGTFVGATPKSVREEDMILVDRLQYDDQADTLRVRLIEKQCRSRGAGAGGDSTPYVLRVRFPDALPNRVCARERGGRDKGVCTYQ